MKRRATSKRRVAEGDDEQCSQAAKIFATWEILRQNLAPPALEHLKQDKTKYYEKISLKNKETYKILKIKDINENPKLKT